ncbi:MAG: FG-GAP-like repeat-containing protein, partial [Planctomycetota bacterium]
MECAKMICRAAVIIAVVLGLSRTGAAEIPFQYRVVDPEMGPGHCDILTVGDVNGDGNQDMIAALTQGPVFWFENPSLEKHQVWKEWMYWSCNGEVGDMDNDGDNDI